MGEDADQLLPLADLGVAVAVVGIFCADAEAPAEREHIVQRPRRALGAGLFAQRRQAEGNPAALEPVEQAGDNLHGVAALGVGNALIRSGGKAV